MNYLLKIIHVMQKNKDRGIIMKNLHFFIVLFGIICLTSCGSGNDDPVPVSVENNVVAKVPPNAFSAAFDAYGGEDVLGEVEEPEEAWRGGMKQNHKKGSELKILMQAKKGDNVFLLNRFVNRYIELTDAGIKIGYPISNETPAEANGHNYIYQRFEGGKEGQLDFVYYLDGNRIGKIEVMLADDTVTSPPNTGVPTVSSTN
jgi:hypothetical protein